MERQTAIWENVQKANTAKQAGTSFFQPKLTVNQPNDSFEQEADSMADKVMRMTAASTAQNTFFKPSTNTIQRKCAACGEEEKHAQRKESSDNETQSAGEIDSYVGSLSSSGQQLPQSSRNFFEPRFGHDFSGVRVHNDAAAAKSAESINALAYTTGNNIVFNSGQFSPGSAGGDRLLAHELTHVIQQQTTQPTASLQKAPGLSNPQPPPSTEMKQSVTENISNAPPQYANWNKSFTWESRFQVTYDLNSKHVVIVSRLYSTATDALKAGWKAAIEDRWGKGKFNMEVWDSCEPKSFPIDVDIQWVTDPRTAHYTIKATAPGTQSSGGTSGVGGTNSMTDWGTANTADVPHEYGHMLGNPEEYFTTNGIDYTYGGTKSGFRDYRGGIMNNPSEAPMPRHYELVRQGFARMMPFDLGKVRVVQNGTYNPPMLNCGGQQNKAVA